MQPTAFSAAHELGAAAYAIKAARASAPEGQGESVGWLECGGSVNSSQRRFVNWSSMINGCETTSAGRCSTADTSSISRHCLTSAPSHALANRGAVSVVLHAGALATLRTREPRLERTMALVSREGHTLPPATITLRAFLEEHLLRDSQ